MMASGLPVARMMAQAELLRMEREYSDNQLVGLPLQKKHLQLELGGATEATKELLQWAVRTSELRV
jgi:hypothetical protein